MLCLSYKCVTQQIYAQQITFNSVNFKITVNQLIMKLDNKNIICVCMLVFYDSFNFLASYACMIKRKLKMLITRLKAE